MLPLNCQLQPTLFQLMCGALESCNNCSNFSLFNSLWECYSRYTPWGDISHTSQISERIKEGKRPLIPNGCGLSKLITSCWQLEALARPKFSDIYSELESLKKQAEEAEEVLLPLIENNSAKAKQVAEFHKRAQLEQFNASPNSQHSSILLPPPNKQSFRENLPDLYCSKNFLPVYIEGVGDQEKSIEERILLHFMNRV
jgi:hypothetical protein